MIKPIMKDVLFLAQPSEPATAKDKNINNLHVNIVNCLKL